MDICLATRPYNGGLLDLEELRTLLEKRRRASPERVTDDDCMRAISKLKVVRPFLPMGAFFAKAAVTFLFICIHWSFPSYSLLAMIIDVCH